MCLRLFSNFSIELGKFASSKNLTTCLLVCFACSVWFLIPLSCVNCVKLLNLQENCPPLSLSSCAQSVQWWKWKHALLCPHQCIRLQNLITTKQNKRISSINCYYWIFSLVDDRMQWFYWYFKQWVLEQGEMKVVCTNGEKISKTNENYW